MLNAFYGNFGEKLLKYFLPALLLHRAIGKLHVKKTECRTNDFPSKSEILGEK